MANALVVQWIGHIPAKDEIQVRFLAGAHVNKFSKKLKGLIDFIEFNHEFRKVLRIARIPNDTRLENDAEHSHQLALVAWYIIENDQLPLKLERILMYAMAHDLVEVYAGDTYTFDKVSQTSKKDREHKALQKIKKRFPKFKTLIKTIENYENKIDKESKFVYALDKIIPPIQVYLEDGKLWKEKKISLQDVMENKNHKIKTVPEIDIYWQEFLKEMKRLEKKLF